MTLVSGGSIAMGVGTTDMGSGTGGERLNSTPEYSPSEGEFIAKDRGGCQWMENY